MGTPYIKTDDKTAEEMFEFWFKNSQNKTATAKEFGVDRSRIYRLISIYRWKKRAEEIYERIRRGLNTKLVSEAVGNVERVEGMLTNELEAYDKKDATGNHRHIMDMIRYLDEAQGYGVDPDDHPDAKKERSVAQDAEIVAAVKEYDREMQLAESEDDDADGD